MITSEAPAGELRRNIEYAHSGGQSLLMDAFVPAGAGPFPAAIVVHGGAWVTGDRRWNVEPLFQPLAEAGCAWFSISYRLAKQFSNLGAGVEDIALALAHVRAHAREYNADAGRIALVGESAGGQLVALAGLGGACAPVQAVVSLYAPMDLEQLAKDSKYMPEPMRFAMGAGMSSLLLPQLRKLSPLRHLREGMPPFLLIHGTGDALVPFEQSREMCRAIRGAGGQCDLVAVKGGGHGLRWWESSGLTGYKRLMAEWLEKRLAVPARAPPLR